MRDDGFIGNPFEQFCLHCNSALAQPIRFTAVYDVATVDDGFLILYPDVYKRVRSKVRDEVNKTLREAGVDPARVNREHLERLLDKSETRRVAISLEELTSPTPIVSDGMEDSGR